ncbi:DNA-directed RNA polymerase II subunit RPB2 [Microthyrium microscopicum]|uniref:DNA-directed RNA polymerase subunit beta n=1 Tax=Microthyrium microscopicum TaxID=703497 RepID=A0A6A6U8M2_9PEZI|nr:DNA-directed RNA polymerase II subunit RPB2 [Microthyrium microscopicum]
MAEYDFEEEYDDYGADDTVSAEDSWSVITSFFSTKGLVAQQIDSYDEFAQRTLQDIVLEMGRIVFDQNFPGDAEGAPAKRRVDMKMDHLKLSHPQILEQDGSNTKLFPNEARLRNLTYASHMYVDVTKNIQLGYQRDPDADPNTLQDDDLDWQKDGPNMKETDVKKNRESIPIGKLPIMLKSQTCMLRSKTEAELYAKDECPLDQGGYFIISGSEKVLIAQERSAGNIVQVFKKRQSPTPWVAEIRSVMEKGPRALSSAGLKYFASSSDGGTGGNIRVTLPMVNDNIPVVIVFRALGVVSDEDIINHICFDRNDQPMMKLIRKSIEDGFLIQNKSAALDYIARRAMQQPSGVEKRVKAATENLQKDFLPHISQEQGSETKKAYFLGYMVYRMCQCILGRRDEDDRDHFGKKRLDLAGVLMAQLFKIKFKQMVQDAQKYIQKSLEDGRDFHVSTAFKQATITSGLKYSLATGNWGDQKKAASARAGVSQVLNRFTFASTLSHLRRTNTPIGRDGKLAKPRQLHNTHWGLVCPAETPEGQACGLVKNLSLMCYVTVMTPWAPLVDFMLLRGMEYLEEYDPLSNPNATKIFINGTWIGIHRDPNSLHRTLRLIRGKEYLLHESVSIIRDIRDREIRIFTDAGRVCRPLYVVDNVFESKRRGQLALTRAHLDKLQDESDMEMRTFSDQEIRDRSLGWVHLLKEGVVELLDAEEEEQAMIAMTPEDLDAHTALKAGQPPDVPSDDPHRRIKPKPNAAVHEYTHCEIHPAMILGVCASIIPFPDHNQSPRNTYQSAMGKQAMGVALTNYQLRFDTMNNVLYYPQKPLATTRSMEYLKFRDLPAGQNAIVAIACYGGYNQEDSVIMNQHSIDRGLFRSLYYRTYTEQQKQVGLGYLEEFEKPNRNETIKLKPGTYDKLDVDGIVAPGTRVTGEDIIIGKTAPIDPDSEELGQRTKAHTKRDVSIPLRSTESGIVDSVLLTTNEQDLKFIRVRTRVTKTPQIGDKFASRHGQKGTIGVTYRQEDMPFSREGLTPDLIINPHAIPSRMTIAHLIECLLSKVGSIRGNEGDATPFTDVTITDISGLLREAGYQSRGFEVMYNGHTGKKLRAQVFLGPTYYQRLRHMVDDKIHARARGPMQILTRQPVEGRARDGGLRFGEMERDCMIAHGAAAFLKERLFEVSDTYRAHICEICGLMSPIVNYKRQTFECRPCKNRTRVAQIHIPYAAKLLFQELMSMNIAPRLFTDDSGISVR